MRQRLSDKNVKKYSEKLGLDIDRVLVRGGTNHRKDIITKDGERYILWNDGELEHDLSYSIPN